MADPKPGAEAQKEHPAPLIASERLHSSIIDHLDRTPEGLGEIKSDPAAAQIVGLVEGTPMDHGPRKADRDAAILPVLSDVLNIPYHFACGHA